MRIKILASALEDLYTWREFYDKQMEGMGEYFSEALFVDTVIPKLLTNEF